MTAQVARRPGGDDLERAAAREAPAQQRVAFAFLDVISQGAAQRRRRRKDRLDVGNHVVAAVGLGRQQRQDRRRLIGDIAADRAAQQRGEADPHRLDQA